MLVLTGLIPPSGAAFAPGTLLDVRATNPVSVIDRSGSATGLLVRGPAANNPGTRSSGADILGVAWNGVCYDIVSFLSVLVAQGLDQRVAFCTLNSLPMIVCSDEQYATGGPVKGLGVLELLTGTDAFTAQFYVGNGVPDVPFIPTAPSIIAVRGRIDYDDPGVGFTFDLTLQVNGVLLPVLFANVSRASGGSWSALFSVELLVSTVAPGAMNVVINQGCMVFDANNPSASLPKLVSPAGPIALPNPPGSLNLDISVAPAGASPVTAALSQLRTSLWRPLT